MSRMLEIEYKATESFDVATWVMADCSLIKTVGKYSMKTHVRTISNKTNIDNKKNNKNNTCVAHQVKNKHI